MSEQRSIREEPSSSHKKAVTDSLGKEYRDTTKIKQQEVFVTNKYDGLGDSLVTTNMNDVNYGSFSDESMVGGTGFIPALSALNDNSQVQELRFFNLEGVCQAEKEILHKIIHNSQWYSDSLFCFMRRSPSPGDPTVALDSESSERCLTDIGGEVDVGIPEVSGDPDIVQGNISDDGSHIHNGPILDPMLDLSQPHITAIDEDGGLSNVLPPGVSPGNIRQFYPSQAHLAVSTAGSGQTMPPTSVQIPVSGGQMVMYPPQMQQLMQPSHGGYSMSVGYPPIQYGYPQHSGQPHVTYVSPTGEPISPESVHMAPPPSHKGHHDGHHGIPHSTSGPGGTSAYKSRRRDNVKQQQQQQQPYYYPGYGYPAGMPYHSHQQLAQNVTGSPIIMQAPGNIYPYHQPPHPSMYPQNTTGAEMEHHPANVGMAQTMSHITGEIPSYAQHHQVPPMYHHSPTHNVNHSGNYPPSSRGNIHPPVEHSPNVAVDSPSDIENVDVEKVSEVELSQSTLVETGAHGRDVDNSQKKSLNSDDASVSQDTNQPIPIPIPDVLESQQDAILGSKIDSLTEPRRDNEIVDRITPPPLSQRVTDKKIHPAKSTKAGNGGVVDSQIKGTSEYLEMGVTSNETPSVNGEIKDIKMNTGKGAPPRDKLSADPKMGVSGKFFETKSKPHVNVSNSRSVNVVSDTTSDKKLESECASGEFPTLSSNSLSNINVFSTSASSSSSGNSNASATAKGRSWASIASAKSQLAGPDGAIQTTKRVGAFPQGVDHGSGDNVSVSCASRLNPEHFSNCHLSSNQSDQDLAKPHFELETDCAGISDENDPVALALGDFLRNYTLDHHSIALTPRGLCNQGNYCYINATLQSLLACPPLVNLFRAMGDILNKRPCRATPIIQNVFELVSEFEPLLRGNANKKDRMKDVFHVGANLEPIGIRKCLGLLEGNTFKVEGRQEDAEEFLSHLLNGLHDEMLKVMKWAEQRKEKSSNKQNASSSITSSQGATNGGGVEINGEEDDDQWQVMGAKNKSCITRKTAVSKTPVSEAFLGQMCYLYRVSSTGSQKSATLQPFYTLQLDIQNDNIRSVRDALEAISAKEEVSGMLSANGSEVEAWRQLSLEELPIVLILHLKRFVYEKNGNKIRKIDKKLDFGIELEIAKDLLSTTARNKYNIRQRQYKLFAVVYHDGEEAHKGHYIADCFHASGGSMWGQCGWLRFDDTSVKQIPESQMLNPQPPRVPYLLYYRRGDTLLSHVTQPQQQQLHKKERP